AGAVPGVAGAAPGGGGGGGGDASGSGGAGQVIMTFSAGLAVTTAPIPTMGEWSLILLSSLVAMFGIARVRSRRQ
ncbi:MAG: IPTL-CTERM sorting domain-containing protein, partial [Comamonadaceae bacterium]